jgi:type III restriction enzyme
MTSLYEVLRTKINEWRTGGYSHPEYSSIAEMLEWAGDPEGSGFRLRPPQQRALETYWYLRLVEGTPHITELYRRLFSRQSDLLAALGLIHQDIRTYALDFGTDAVIQRIRTDDQFVRQFHLEALRETLTLSYPSYILALAMGAGKTALIGAIIATEFAMASEYPDGPFVQNALVFAPGTTIIESLRELAEIPYDRILPPRFYKGFAASVKLTFTREGEKGIPVIPESIFNVVVTNTEKIRIQKETVRKSDLGSLLLDPTKEDEARAEVANLRLQTIASLPHLAVFSDEAHHTYGQALDTGLKKVRKTVDYLYHESPNLICVVNTTGTPYYRRQPLRDVVIWYGLSEGIRDGILKEVAGNIFAYSFDDSNTDKFVAEVIGDFFKSCGSVTLPDGSLAKLALYFPQTDDLEELRPVIETKLAELGLPPAICLRNTSESTKDEIDAFNRLSDPASQHRVMLLVNKGTEGWNCPSLFACALARRLRTSNNFVLQAASRCLRQIPGNKVEARIYLSMDNRAVLDRQLQETYGETIAELNEAKSNTRRDKIRLVKIKLPPFVIRKLVRTVVRKEEATPKSLVLTRPAYEGGAVLEKVRLDIAEQVVTRSVLKQIADTVEVKTTPVTTDLYSAAVELAAVYRLDVWNVLEELRRIYVGKDEIPISHLAGLASQIEGQTRSYDVQEETVEVALALVKPDGFNKELAEDGTEFYTAEITYPIDREQLLTPLEMFKDKAGRFGFHYTPYDFDSNPEKSFFLDLLDQLHLHPEKIEDVYFTGAVTDPNKTEFYVEYIGEDGKPHRYTPDFIIRRKDGKCLIVEIKDARFEAATREDIERHKNGNVAITVEGRKAVALTKWEELNPDRLKYEILFVRDETVAYNQTKPIRAFLEK